ncbi:hypothetical protein EJ05DRAFT_477977 [Pseudovirgaria hyperparasitica]|uniref:Uncharacterized protein n=1 Tax=Pseudovirgaria hyperparasitica TaxID=470096 RepID=A0A6A6W1P1_9PEZI|nr:uncharacterized protein EJ05DRAFT_477977 [Pseudovirgaria hyperparasitica]KAF2755914.1 hypothetical protein EJ05DRAFT_477977 [Pseudovirgaria hyperparasitica]
MSDLLSPSTSSSGSTRSTSSTKVVCRSGIGGRGNYRKVCASEVPPMPASFTLPPRPQRNYSSGIGGAGNHHSSNNRSLLDMEDQIERDRVFKGRPKNRHYGIGGFGNFVDSSHSGSGTRTRTPSSSAFSSEPLPYGALDSLSRKLSSTFLRRKGSTTFSSTS